MINNPKIQITNTTSYNVFNQQNLRAPSVNVCFLKDSKVVLPIHSTSYDVKIDSGHAIVKMIQEFKNDDENIANIQYICTIPD